MKKAFLSCHKVNHSFISISINIKIGNKFTEIKNSISDWFIIFVTNNRRLNVGIDCVTDVCWNMLGKSIKSIPLLMKRILFKMPNMIRFGIDKWTKSMLSITSFKQSSIVHFMNSIVKCISLRVQGT